MQNEEKINHPDTAFILAFSIVMLNTDQHNPSIKPEKKMKVRSRKHCTGRPCTQPSFRTSCRPRPPQQPTPAAAAAPALLTTGLRGQVEDYIKMNRGIDKTPEGKDGANVDPEILSVSGRTRVSLQLQ